jgi:putative membrane protein
MDLARERRLNKWITVISIAVPLVVAVLFGVKIPNAERLGFLPPIYATLNGFTAVLLMTGFWAIKVRKKRMHHNIMTTCVVLSALFLIMYIAYHMTSDPTEFGGTGMSKYIYFFILITHILLSIILIPLVLRTYAHAYLKKFEAHKKLARITFPIWLYVAVSGVVVYRLISPYNPN